jgi:hypothetical protein
LIGVAANSPIVEKETPNQYMIDDALPILLIFAAFGKDLLELVK